MAISGLFTGLCEENVTATLVFWDMEGDVIPVCTPEPQEVHFFVFIFFPFYLFSLSFCKKLFSTRSSRIQRGLQTNISEYPWVQEIKSQTNILLQVGLFTQLLIKSIYWTLLHHLSSFLILLKRYCFSVFLGFMLDGYSSVIILQIHKKIISF